MNYQISRECPLSFDQAVIRMKEELQNEGFGVISDIDIKDTLKKKLNADFRRYRILGACNPQYAYQALQADDKIGVMLPCNVVVQEKSDGKTEVSAIDPTASMQSINNPVLDAIASQVKAKLVNAIQRL